MLMPGTRPGIRISKYRLGDKRAPCGITAAGALSPSRRGGGEIAELLQICLLLLVARRQLEQARRGAAEDVVLGLLRQERQVVDGRRQIKIPVRIVGGVKELRLRRHSP